MTDQVQQEKDEQQTQETQQQDQTQEVVTQTDVQAEESLAKGYHKAKGTTPEDTTKTTAAEDTKSEGATDTTTETPNNNQAAAAAVAEAVKVFGMTEAEFKTALDKAGQGGATATAEVRKAFGKIGEITRTLQQLQQNLSAPKGRKITAEALKRVNEELPGLGAALAQDLQEILGGADQAQATAEAKGQQFDPDKYHTEKVAPALENIETRLAEAQDEMQNSLLTFMHPDWQSYLKTDGFKNWLQTLPEDQRTAVRTSPHASVAGKAITDAKAWNEQQKKAAKRKNDRLEAAVTPKGTNAAPAQSQPSEEESLRRGYHKAKGK